MSIFFKQHSNSSFREIIDHGDIIFLLSFSRQGHLPMVILLLQYGADPALIDGEGFCGIHLAVLFQHMPIIAYLISKGQVCFETYFVLQLL